MVAYLTVSGRLEQKVTDQTCYYCQRPGHWKNECPVLKAKGKVGVKGKALAAKPC